MEQKEGNSRSGRRSNNVGPDRIAHTISELYMMTNAKVRWRGARHLHYDSYDARLRSFINWPRHMRPTSTTIASTGFFYVGMTYSKNNKHSLRIYNVRLLHIRASECLFHFTTGTGDRTICFHCGAGLQDGWRRTIPGSSTGPGPNSVFRSDTSKDPNSSRTAAKGGTPFLHTERVHVHNLMLINCMTSHTLNKTELFEIL